MTGRPPVILARPEPPAPELAPALDLLKLHHESFFNAAEFAEATDHPVPSDTRAWSQILVSLLTGIKGMARKKGADFADGSDVKGANVWLAIDTPRFNGCIKSGRKGDKGNMKSLDGIPWLFFVLWDHEPTHKRERCRVWVVRPCGDAQFRRMCAKWYQQRDDGVIKSDNFQLHPPRNKDSDVFTNECGNLSYPLLFGAHWVGNGYTVVTYNPDALTAKVCVAAG